MPTHISSARDWLAIPLTGALTAALALVPGPSWLPVIAAVLIALVVSAVVVYRMRPVIETGVNVLAVLTLLGLALLLAAPILFVPFALVALVARTLGLTDRVIGADDVPDEQGAPLVFPVPAHAPDDELED